MKKIKSLKEVTKFKRKNKHKKLKKGRYKKKKYAPLKFKRKKAKKKTAILLSFAVNKKRVVDTHTFKEKYHDYLKSNIWKIKRGKVLKRANYKCELCKINRAWQVHHKNYNRVFKERLSDLTAICGTCHKGEHDLLTEEEIELKVIEMLKQEGYK